MSRLRGEKLTEWDWRLYRKLKWVHHEAVGKAHLIPRRIYKRLDLCYLASFNEMKRNFYSGGFAMPARVLAKPPTGVAYVFSPVD